MKSKTILFFLTLSVICIISSYAFADGLYPIGQQYQSQPVYPIPQYYPYGQQQPTPNYQNQQPYYQNQQQQQPYYYPQPDPQPFSPQPQNPYYNIPNQPFYDPYSQRYYYPISQDDQWYQWYQPQSSPRQDSNVQVSTQRSYNNTVNLTWTIRNVTGENWASQNVDILCTNGCYLLTDQSRTRWDIPYTVKRNGMLSFTVNIRNARPGSAMSFAMVAGSKTLYTFNVNL